MLRTDGYVPERGAGEVGVSPFHRDGMTLLGPEDAETLSGLADAGRVTAAVGGREDAVEQVAGEHRRLRPEAGEPGGAGTGDGR